MTKAQIFSLDALIAVGVFVIIITSIGWTWIVTKDRYNTIEARNDIEMPAENVLSSLLETPENPITWHLELNRTGTPAPPADDDSECIPTGDYNCAAYGEKNISSLGLAKTPNFLDIEKIKKLREINETNYSLIKQFLGIRGPGYEWYIAFYQFNGTAMINRNNITIGRLPNKTVGDVIVKQRMALIENWTLVRMEVWR